MELITMKYTGIDHVEIYVDDLDEALNEFCGKYGFVVAAKAVPATDRRSVLVLRGTARLVLTTATGTDGEVAAFLQEHGDGVRDIALRVDDATAAFAAAVGGGGGRAVREPRRDGGMVTATVEGLTTLVHTFVQRADDDVALPGFAAVATAPTGTVVDPAAVRAIDHMAICLPAGTLDDAEQFFANVLGLRRSFTERVEFAHQAMDSVVVEDADRSVTFTLVSPDCSHGQLVNFLDAYRGGGVQHLAFLTDQITEAVPQLSSRGVQFLSTPEPYYEALPSRLGYSSADAKVLSSLGVLVDRDPWGELLQIFIRSPFSRNTLFFELIERRSARTFGSSNIRALYEAAENVRNVGAVPA
ncbi:4-hydroxyphenylpyruvate dioxygenase [Streptomyces chartreusis]|uniref:4-hydroxyphenylpyruvate dioxygenase n=1 Tax=Streptomyces chartreusis TaxID=1969 RepID=UPI0036BDFC75